MHGEGIVAVRRGLKCGSESGGLRHGYARPGREKKFFAHQTVVEVLRRLAEDGGFVTHVAGNILEPPPGKPVVAPKWGCLVHP